MKTLAFTVEKLLRRLIFFKNQDHRVKSFGSHGKLFFITNTRVKNIYQSSSSSETIYLSFVTLCFPSIYLDINILPPIKYHIQ